MSYSFQLPVLTEERILPKGSIVRHSYVTYHRIVRTEYLYLEHCNIKLGYRVNDPRSDSDVTYIFINCFKFNCSAGSVLPISPIEMKRDFKILRYGMKDWVNGMDRSKFESILKEFQEAFPYIRIRDGIFAKEQ